MKSLARCLALPAVLILLAVQAEAGPRVFRLPDGGMERLGESRGEIYVVGDGAYRFTGSGFERIAARLDPLPEDDRRRITSASKGGDGPLVIGAISWGARRDHCSGCPAGVLYAAENDFRPINIAPADDPLLVSALYGVASTPEGITAVGTYQGTLPLVWNSILGIRPVEEFPAGVCCTGEGDSRFLSISGDGGVVAGYTDPPHTGDIDPTIAVMYSMRGEEPRVLQSAATPSASRSLAFHVSARGSFILGLTPEGLTRWNRNGEAAILYPRRDVVGVGFVMERGDALFRLFSGEWMFYDEQSRRVTPYLDQWRGGLEHATGDEAEDLDVLDVNDSFEMSHWRVDLVRASTGSFLAFYPLRGGPDLTGVRRRAEGVVEVTAVGLPDTEYVVEAADNCARPVRWQLLAAVRSDGRGELTFDDEGMPNRRARFYRFLRP